MPSDSINLRKKPQPSFVQEPKDSYYSDMMDSDSLRKQKTLRNPSRKRSPNESDFNVVVKLLVDFLNEVNGEKAAAQEARYPKRPRDRHNRHEMLKAQQQLQALPRKRQKEEKPKGEQQLERHQPQNKEEKGKELYRFGREDLDKVSSRKQKRKVNLFQERVFENSSPNDQLSSHRNKSKEKRVFRRATYHIAIAYHIHLKKCEARASEMAPQELDPTYEAQRMTREQESRQQMREARQQRRPLNLVLQG